MLLLVRIDLSAADLALFEGYEATVLPLLPNHGGRLEARLRAVDGLSETHLIHFPNEAAFAAYRADPARQAVQPIWDRSGAQALVTPVVAIG